MSTNSPLMLSVSGIRGIAQKSFDDDLIRRYIQAFGTLQRKEAHPSSLIIVGRDSRVSGKWAQGVVHEVLTQMGFKVLDLGIVPTPTVQYMVIRDKARCGIIVTSSHNPIEWNGLKFVGSDGLFLSAAKCTEMFAIAKTDMPVLETPAKLDEVQTSDEANTKHIEAILALPEVDTARVQARKFKVCLDTVNGAGGPIMKEILTRFGCEVVALNYETTGKFSHPPEPIPEHLEQLCRSVVEEKADFGVATDPDVDRCVFIDETGKPIGEEYTLALAVEYWLGTCGKRGPIVKNLSSSMANDAIANKYGCQCHKAAVGEANVANKMLDVNATIGGEGNGGVMLPDIHIGRDAPVALSLVISLLARFPGTLSELKKTLPQWYIVKTKISVESIDADATIAKIAEKWKNEGAEISSIDGIHIQTNDWWAHIRKSNTEPIVRVIAEAQTEERANEIAQNFLNEVNDDGFFDTLSN